MRLPAAVRLVPARELQEGQRGIMSLFITRVINFDREHILQFSAQLQVFSIQYRDMSSFIGAKFPIKRGSSQRRPLQDVFDGEDAMIGRCR